MARDPPDPGVQGSTTTPPLLLKAGPQAFQGDEKVHRGAGNVSLSGIIFSGKGELAGVEWIIIAASWLIITLRHKMKHGPHA